MKENRKLLKDVLDDIRQDMSDEEVLALLANRKISVRPESEKKYTLGQRAADAIAKFAGSWAFIFSFTGVLVLWMLVNIIMASNAFDPYPFILLNLVLSCIAAIQAPLIMMSQNRQEEKDRRRAENDYKVNLKTEIMIEAVYNKVNALLAKQSALEKNCRQKITVINPKINDNLVLRTEFSERLKKRNTEKRKIDKEFKSMRLEFFFLSIKKIIYGRWQTVIGFFVSFLKKIYDFQHC